MKIALVAMPRPQQNITRVAPPLPLAYLAALLEQRRHIVRIYDLALPADGARVAPLASLKVFRPHLVVVAADGSEIAEVEAMLDGVGALIMRLDTALRDATHSAVAARVLVGGGEQRTSADEQSVIFETVRALSNDLDSLPFPARHLLPLEKYPFRTPNGELQTPVLVAQSRAGNQVVPRRAAQVIAEIESVIREYGIRHFLFPEPFGNCNGVWLYDLLQQFIATNLDIRWEASICADQLEPAMLPLFRQAGCEVLCVGFSAGAVLESREQRAELAQLVTRAHALGISVRGEIDLSPPFGALAALVDLSATFGLDAVSYTLLRQAEASRMPSASDEKLLGDVMRAERSRRSREMFVDRFGPQLGPMIWHVGRVGLLGATWRRHAYGEDSAYVF